VVKVGAKKSNDKYLGTEGVLYFPQKKLSHFMLTSSKVLPDKTGDVTHLNT
jgi:hypothetical protein